MGLCVLTHRCYQQPAGAPGKCKGLESDLGFEQGLTMQTALDMHSV